MDKVNAAQVSALRAVVGIIQDAIAAAGPEGIPAGHLYAALMPYGCTLRTFETLTNALTTAGKIRRSGDLLIAQECRP